MILCAGNSESFKFAVPIGVGLIDSAINLTKIISLNRPNEIVFIGSAGVYADLELLRIYESYTAANYEISALLNKSYTPISYEIDSIVPRETMKTNSSNFITTDEISAQKFAKMGYNLENMEFYSVLKVAKFYQIPAYGIFVTTNFCNENAHEDFIKNHKESKEILTKYLKTKGLI